MQHSPQRVIVAAVILCILTVRLLPSIARADARTDARREYRAGMQQIAERKYDQGIQHLERAYDYLPHPNVLFNIGLAHLYAGRNEAAVEVFEVYKETAPISEVAASEVEQVLAAAAAELRRLGRPSAAEEIERLNARMQGAADPQSSAASAGPTAASPTPAEPGIPGAPTEIAPQTPPRADVPSAEALPMAPSPSTPVGLYEEQVVSASRFSQSPLDAPNATAIITAQDIRMSGLIQLSALLRRVAGIEISTIAPFHAEVSIRGLNRRTSNKVLLLWDGRPMRKDFLGNNWIDMVPILVDDIERIEIIRGPASALYGADAFSGVINIITRAPGEGGSFIVGYIGNRGQIQGGSTFSGRQGPVAYRASASYTQAHNTVQVVGDQRVDVARPNGERVRGFEQFGANGDLSYRYAKRGVASIGGNYGGGDFTVGGLSRLGQVISDPAYNAQVYGAITTPIGIRLGTNYDHVVGHPSAASVAPGSIASRKSFIRQRLYDLDLSHTSSFRLGVPNTLTVGVSYRYKHIQWDWLDATHTQHHIGAYVQDVVTLSDALRLQVGARIDRHPLLSSLQFSPRASLVVRFLTGQSLRLSGGRAFRGPSFIESYLDVENDTPIRGVSALGKGNTKLDPESITSIEIGYQNQASDYFSVEANAYYNWIKDAILFTALDEYTLGDYAGDDPRATFGRDVRAYPVSTLSFANERATYRQFGGELGLRLYPIPGFDVYGNYAVHRTEPIDEREVDPARAREQQTSLHKVNSGVQYRSWFGGECSIDVSWLSRQHWIEQVLDVDRGGLRWQAYQQPAFLMLSARVGYRLFRDRLEFGVVGTNLASPNKRQHPLAQPIDTRVLGKAKVTF